jgi:hypothetical protein
VGAGRGATASRHAHAYSAKFSATKRRERAGRPESGASKKPASHVFSPAPAAFSAPRPHPALLVCLDPDVRHRWGHTLAVPTTSRPMFTIAVSTRRSFHIVCTGVSSGSTRTTTMRSAHRARLRFARLPHRRRPVTGHAGLLGQSSEPDPSAVRSVHAQARGRRCPRRAGAHRTSDSTARALPRRRLDR